MSETEPTTLPFGKFKGCTLDVPPVDYLQWLAGVAKSPTLREALERELASRTGMHRDPPPTAPVDAALATAIIRAGVQVIAKHQRVPLTDPAIAAAADFLFVALSRAPRPAPAPTDDDPLF